MPCYISVPQLKRICSVPVLCDEYQQAEFSLEFNTRLTLSFSQVLPFPTGALSSSAFSSSSPPILCSIFPVPYLILHWAYKGMHTHTHTFCLLILHYACRVSFVWKWHHILRSLLLCYKHAEITAELSAESAKAFWWIVFRRKYIEKYIIFKFCCHCYEKTSEINDRREMVYIHWWRFIFLVCFKLQGRLLIGNHDCFHKTAFFFLLPFFYSFQITDFTTTVVFEL